MSILVEVLVAPEPFVLPEEIRGGTAGDTALAATIGAVANSIAAPSGWLGRSLGEQTLRYSTDRFTTCLRLPCGPVLEVVSVKYTDPAGQEQTLPESNYRLVGTMLVLTGGAQWPATAREPDAVRVEYRAGYETVPAEAKRAVILGTQHLRDLGGTNVYLRSESVEGVSSKSWAISPQAGDTVQRAIGHLLANLRIYE